MQSREVAYRERKELEEAQRRVDRLERDVKRERRDRADKRQRAIDKRQRLLKEVCPLATVVLVRMWPVTTAMQLAWPTEVSPCSQHHKGRSAAGVSALSNVVRASGAAFVPGLDVVVSCGSSD